MLTDGRNTRLFRGSGILKIEGRNSVGNGVGAGLGVADQVLAGQNRYFMLRLTARNRRSFVLT